ncbi:MAG: hypothetical protein P9L92_12230 [Candidatus Electryonea clarkiae]|nr:hypothetical protein [Candidatus Electryonea clarkiae]MDP8286923.1 hypothetical protein [Candidatus Electryonea clarkiae]
MLSATFIRCTLIGIGILIFFYGYIPNGRYTLTLHPTIGRIAGLGFIVSGILMFFLDLQTMMIRSTIVIVIIVSSMVLLVISMIKK